MTKKGNNNLRKILTVATTVTIVSATQVVQSFANETLNSSLKMDVLLDSKETPEEMAKITIDEANNVLSTQDTKQLSKSLDDLVNLRRHLVKNLKLDPKGSLVKQVKDKTTEVRNKLEEVIDSNVDKMQTRVNNKYKDEKTIPLVQNPNWYYSGLPNRVKVREVETIPEKVIIDVVALEDKELKGDGCFTNLNPIDLMGKDYYSSRPIDLSVVSGTKIDGYLDKDGNFYKNAEDLPSGIFKQGEVMYSLVINSTEPIVKGTKLVNRSYWELSLGDTLDAQHQTALTQDISHGVDRSEAISIAKTTGTNFSVGAELGHTNSGTGNSGKLNINYSIQDSLSKTLNRSMTVSERVTKSIRHDFGTSTKTRKVGLYQFVEIFEQIPNSEYDIHIGMTPFELSQHYASDDKIKLVFNRTSELKTSEFTGVEVEQGQTSINSASYIR